MQYPTGNNRNDVSVAILWTIAVWIPKNKKKKNKKELFFEGKREVLWGFDLKTKLKGNSWVLPRWVLDATNFDETIGEILSIQSAS